MSLVGKEALACAWAVREGAALFVGASLRDTALLAVAPWFWHHSHAERKAAELGIAVGIAVITEQPLEEGHSGEVPPPGNPSPAGSLLWMRLCFWDPSQLKKVRDH